jgi:D,D-heptose 1,7-bisphosphate phosphatase
MFDYSAALIVGGKGTRLNEINLDLPKCLYPFMGSTILDLQLDFLKAAGVERIHLFLGHLYEQVIEHLKQRDSEFIFEYYVEEEPMGTIGNLLLQISKLPELVLVIHGDLFLDFPLIDYVETFVSSDSEFQLLVHPSSHMEDSDVVVSNSSNQIIDLIRKPRPGDLLIRNQTNAGVYIFKKSVLEEFSNKVWKFSGPADLDRYLIPELLNSGFRGTVYRNMGLVKDLGTPQRIESTTKLIQNGHGNLVKPMIFLDRDGVINFDSGWVSNLNDFIILESVPEAIRKLNFNGYRVCVITNQPVIARGQATSLVVEEMHHYLDLVLSKVGAYIDDYFICPHHPDQGFVGEIPELKQTCLCRKPETLLFQRALSRFPTDLSKSYLIGDSWRDEHAARSLNLNFIGISETIGKNLESENLFANLGDAVDFILHSRDAFDQDKSHE